MERTKPTLRHAIAIIIFTILLIWIVFNFERVTLIYRGFITLLGPFLAGTILAFILNLPMSFIERNIFKKPWSKGEKFRGSLRRGVSILGAVLFFIAIFVGVGFLVIPEIARIFTTLSEQLPGYLNDIEIWIEASSDRGDGLSSVLEFIRNSLGDISDQFTNWLRDSVTDLASSALGFVTSFASLLVNIVLAVIFAIYCLAKKETLGRQLKRSIYAIFPERWADSLVSVGSLSISVFSRFVTGQGIEAIVLGLMFFLGMTILRLPYALMIGALTTVTALIPIFGAIFSAVIGGALILIQDPVQALVFIIMAIVIQQVEGDVVYPHVVGNAVGLPSIWTFVAVTLGGAIAGILGMLIAVPLASILYMLIAAYVYKRLSNKQVNPLKLGFVIFDPRPVEGENELARRQRLARIAVGGETHEEHVDRVQAGLRQHTEDLAQEWEDDLERRSQDHYDAVMRRESMRNEKVSPRKKRRWKIRK